MSEPRIFVDFGNSDTKGRVRLTCNGTLEDLARQKIQLSEGLAMTLYSDDADELGNPDELRTLGIAAFSIEEQIWVAVIDHAAIYHASDERGASTRSRSTRNAG